MKQGHDWETSKILVEEARRKMLENPETNRMGNYNHSEHWKPMFADENATNNNANQNNNNNSHAE